MYHKHTYIRMYLYFHSLRVEGLTMPFTSKYKSLRKDSIVNITSGTVIQVQLSLHHGEKCLVDGLTTSFKKISHQQTIRWGEKITTKIRIQDIPKVTTSYLFVEYKSFRKYSNVNTMSDYPSHVLCMYVPLYYAYTLVHIP